MVIEIDPAAARAVATRLGNELNAVEKLESSVNRLIADAVLDSEGDVARRELTEGHAKLESLSQLIRLYADKVETTDATLAQQIEAKLAAAFGTFYATCVRNGPSDPKLTGPLPGESTRDYLVRMTAAMTETRLRQLGLLTGATNGLYDDWLTNAARNGVHADEVIKIAQDQKIKPADFDFLAKEERVIDNDGKSYFLLSPANSPAAIQKAVLLTYILNAGTGYGAAEGNKDFPETPYSAAEVNRIYLRTQQNAWSYGGGASLTDVTQVHLTGGRIATTPNGMLIAMRGEKEHPWIPIDLAIQRGGTTFGDLFTLPDSSSNPAEVLRSFIRSGSRTLEFEDGSTVVIDNDRLLHHEERHSQQWAHYGEAQFAALYASAEVDSVAKKALPYWLKKRFADEAGLSVEEWELNRFELRAGARDGGYLK